MFDRARLLATALCLCLSAAPAQAADVLLHYLKRDIPPPPTLSNLDPVPEDLGLAGARVGIADNTTTGRFLGHAFSLAETRIDEAGDLLAAAREALAETPFLILDAPASDLLAVADLPEAQGAILFNTSDGARTLRDDQCRANLLHTKPSDAMRTDALAQVLVKKRWTELVMIAGPYPADQAYAEAMRSSLRKFGLKLKAEKTWEFGTDMRRNATQEVPLFTQDFGDYDALIVADATDDFGRYIEYNTWRPRPVAGTDGLSPQTWAPVVEQWGAAQLQSRFTETAGRDMRPRDYAAWAAVRVIGEAVTRTNSDDAATLRSYILSDAFELAGFKGRPLTFRSWNGQMRQPIPVVHPRALVAQAPLEGFLHRVTELDTLGLDEPESACTAFR